MTEKQKKLAETNHNLIYSFLRKMNLSIEEYYDLAAIGLCKAAASYKEDISRFSTYAYQCMFTQIMMDKRKETQEKTIPQSKLYYYEEEVQDAEKISFIHMIPAKNNTQEEALVDIYLQEYMNKIKDNEKLILNLYHAGYTQREIAERIKLSQAQVSRICNKFVKWLNS